MEESSGAQYALQVALQTLKDRCQQFQQRITDLEDENLALRSTHQHITSEISLPEIEGLHQQITLLTEQKAQLCKRIQMVTSENNNLWARLSKLSQDKENLDNKLTQINHTITNRPQTNLIRSKTFTQNDPHIVFAKDNICAESEKLSLELEDISLKLLNSFAKEKRELEFQCSQMAEIQNTSVLLSTYAFAPLSDDEMECDDLEKQLASMKMIRSTLLKQKEKLEGIRDLIATKGKSTCRSCQIEKSTTSASVQTLNNSKSSTLEEDSAQLQSLLNWGTPENSLHNNVNTTYTTSAKDVLINDTVKICPMCSKIFYNADDLAFQSHVEEHFILENDDNFSEIGRF